ncbi:hypothetical protein [Cognatiyoonia sp. IB215182]|uniref:hypothetical protein n=1 Tax=Cognatiyoonia sp. IB215182 TaxID=3097353 RepID=UPI002A129676|nr:hypothetical protein [Cognatiyoonia sp. IB215182]MDX8353086.1 hypothetical protein [Cognatiyoonia sp. IB215182]
MFKRVVLFVLTPVLVILGALGLYLRDPAPLDTESFNALYTSPAPAPNGQRQVFHIGHSLVGRNMPAMLAQLAGEGHGYASQLGWGATLKSHWDPDVPINGFETENNHPAYRDAHEAVESGEYDALVLTEMVEIKDAIRYFDSPVHLGNWAGKAAANNLPVYLYETWHQLDDEEGWLNRIDRDRALYWEDGVMRPALARVDNPQPIYVIPGGQVMAAFSRHLEQNGPIGPLSTHDDLFIDKIHYNDYGAYLMALTHYAVLYQRSPVGLPHSLSRADGTPADDVGAEAAAAMQQVVWDVVTSSPMSGIPVPSS